MDKVYQARSQAFLWGVGWVGGQIGQILGPFMKLRVAGLSCDRVGFGHLLGGGGGRGGQMIPRPPPPPPWLRACVHFERETILQCTI